MLVLPGNITDRKGGEQLLAGVGAFAPRLKHLFVDGGYKGKWVTWVEETLGLSVEVVQHAYAGLGGFYVEPYWVSWRLCSHAASLGMACA